MSDTETPDLTKLTVELLSAYFASNTVPSETLAELIASTRQALAGSADAASDAVLDDNIHKPAVSIKKSIANPDYLVSLIDGKPYKMLKRHLRSHGLTFAEYKERYKLPATYPSVAPIYSQARRDAATRIGLGGRKTAGSSGIAGSPDADALPVLQASGDLPSTEVALNKSQIPEDRAEAPTKAKAATRAKVSRAKSVAPKGGAGDRPAKVKAPKPSDRGKRAQTKGENPPSLQASVTGGEDDATSPAKLVSTRKPRATSVTGGEGGTAAAVETPQRKSRGKLKIATPTD
jgi:predicted transcriptional regulator